MISQHKLVSWQLSAAKSCSKMDDGIFNFTEEDIIAELSQANSDGVVAIEDGGYTGFALYSHNKDHIEIERIAVRKDRRRCGIGSEMLRHVKWVASQRQVEIMVSIPEEDFSSQAFFRDCGFLCYKTSIKAGREFYDFFYRDWG